jgi:hypothetical protein
MREDGSPPVLGSGPTVSITRPPCAVLSPNGPSAGHSVSQYGINADGKLAFKQRGVRGLVLDFAMSPDGQSVYVVDPSWAVIRKLRDEVL